jgi:hypothetical protein
MKDVAFEGAYEILGAELSPKSRIIPLFEMVFWEDFFQPK